MFPPPGSTETGSETGGKPALIVVAVTIEPDGSSEPGKAWWWISALGRYFTPHIITQQFSVDCCKGRQLVEDQGWIFYPTENLISTWRFPFGYWQYSRWLKIVSERARQIAVETPVVGLWHVTLGSFRLLGEYHRLGLPYVIGPIGGGECAPKALLRDRFAPFSHKLAESLRPRLNNAFASVPQLRACMSGARLVLATSEESQAVVRRMGAKRTAVVFPDSYDYPIEVEGVVEHRAAQAAGLKNEIRLLWQGRPLWWKAPDLALVLLQRAWEKGVPVKLTMVSAWSGRFGDRVRALAEKLGVESHADFIAGMPRAEFLALARRHHGFLATSLHDSGGIPLIEAQAQGLPCFTLALGGNRQSACPEAGVSTGVGTPKQFISRSVDCLAAWHADPACWLEQSDHAVRFATRFNRHRLEDYARDLVVPMFTR